MPSLVPISQEALGAEPRQKEPADRDKRPGHTAGWAGRDEQAGLGIGPHSGFCEIRTGFSLPVITECVIVREGVSPRPLSLTPLTVW